MTRLRGPRHRTADRRRRTCGIRWHAAARRDVLQKYDTAVVAPPFAAALGGLIDGYRRARSATGEGAGHMLTLAAMFALVRACAAPSGCC